jgi:peptidoglycan-associated lipoprotein
LKSEKDKEDNMDNNRFFWPLVGLIFLTFSFAACSPQPYGTSQGSDSRSSLEAYRTGKDLPTGESGPMNDVLFAFDRYSLSPDSQEVLKRNAEWLKDNPWAQVQIEGHADERGTSEYNLALGAKRAEATKDYLVAQGVSPDRLSTISYGEELPVCRQNTEGCWQRNRRAHSAIVTVEVGSAT